MRSRVRIPFEPETILPDVTRRLGKPMHFSSDADRLSMERLRQRLARFPPLSTLLTEKRTDIALETASVQVGYYQAHARST